MRCQSSSKLRLCRHAVRQRVGPVDDASHPRNRALLLQVAHLLLRRQQQHLVGPFHQHPATLARAIGRVVCEEMHVGQRVVSPAHIANARPHRPNLQCLPLGPGFVFRECTLRFARVVDRQRLVGSHNPCAQEVGRHIAGKERRQPKLCTVLVIQRRLVRDRKLPAPALNLCLLRRHLPWRLPQVDAGLFEDFPVDVIPATLVATLAATKRYRRGKRDGIVGHAAGVL